MPYPIAKLLAFEFAGSQRIGNQHISFKMIPVRGDNVANAKMLATLPSGEETDVLAAGFLS